MVLRPSFTLESSRNSLKSAPAQALLSGLGFSWSPARGLLEAPQRRALRAAGPMGSPAGRDSLGVLRGPCSSQQTVCVLGGLYLAGWGSSRCYQYWQWSTEIPRSSELVGQGVSSGTDPPSQDRAALAVIKGWRSLSPSLKCVPKRSSHLRPLRLYEVLLPFFLLMRKLRIREGGRIA